jgi:dipeptide/tripeptide permease
MDINIETVMGAATTILCGILLIVIGLLVWKKEKVSLLHSYQYEKVSEEDKKAFCSLTGKGILLLGAGLLVCGAGLIFENLAVTLLGIAAGFVLGMALVISAGKYNK